MFIIDKDDFILHEDMIELCDCLFMHINDRFGSKYRKPVSVLGDNNALLFNVIWESEYCIIKPPHHLKFQCNYYGQDLTENPDDLDLHFIEQLNELYFDSINEYSWHITRLVNYLFPEKKVFFQDENVRFFHDISCSEYNGNRIGVPLFRAGHYPPEVENVYSIYSLMLSLTWLSKRHYNDTYEYDRTVLVIHFSNRDIGFGDIIKICSAYVSVALSRNWIPVICLDHPTQYSDYDGDDCWSKFFVPINSITRSDLYKYKCWISVFENRHIESFGSCYGNLYMNKFADEQKTSFQILLNEKTLAYVKKKIPRQLLEGEAAVGLIVRTTDYDSLAKRKTDPHEVIEAVKNFLSLFPYSHVFLATEDKNILDLFAGTFGEKLLYVDQKRILPYSERESIWISDRFSELYKSKYELGADYISVIYALTGCSVIMVNRYSSALYIYRNSATRILNEIPPYFYISDFSMAFQAMKMQSSVIIYGSGNNGRLFLKCNSFCKLCSVKYFCDRNAEHGEYECEGCRVVSPETVKKEYNGESVVITPYFGKEKIKSMIIGLGIPQDRIIVS